MKQEHLILLNLMKNESFMRKALPFLKSEYFDASPDRKLFDQIQNHITKYNKLPSPSALALGIQERTDLSESEYQSCGTILEDFADEAIENDTDWLLDETEKFCQEKAVYNAIMDSIQILDG